MSKRSALLQHLRFSLFNEAASLETTFSIIAKRNRTAREPFLPMWSFIFGRSSAASNNTKPAVFERSPTSIKKPTIFGKDAPRTKFGPRGCETIAYPSSGGFILGYLTGAELSWLNLSRSKELSRSKDPHQEDAFASNLLKLGARWWPSQELYAKHSDKISEFPYGYHFPPTTHVGYSITGGVWVLKTADDRIRIPGDPEECPENWEKIVMAISMDERSAILEEFGAKLYEEVQLCPDIPKTLEEGIAEGQKYAELLTKMEDDSPGGYLDRWLESL